MSNVFTPDVIATLRERRKRLEKMDCQNERPFLVVRTKASTVLEGLRKAAEEEMKGCEKRMLADASRHSQLCSHAKTAHYLRCLANRIEMEGSDAS